MTDLSAEAAERRRRAEAVLDAIQVRKAERIQALGERTHQTLRDVLGIAGTLRTPPRENDAKLTCPWCQQVGFLRVQPGKEYGPEQFRANLRGFRRHVFEYCHRRPDRAECVRCGDTGVIQNDTYTPPRCSCPLGQALGGEPVDPDARARVLPVTLPEALDEIERLRDLLQQVENLAGQRGQP